MVRGIKLIWNAHPLWAVAESVGLAILVLFLLMSSTANITLARVVFAWFAAVCGLWAALRARLPETRPVWTLVYEVGLTLVLGAALQVVMMIVLWGVGEDETLPLKILPFIVVIVTFLPLRLGMHLWRLWNGIRQRRLLWSIIHAQLVTTVVVVLILLIREVILSISQSQVVYETGVVRQLTLMVILIFGSIVAIPFVAAIMALAGTVSYFTARVITKRVEALAGATSDLRQGDYQARVSVEGQDEIAQLQTDFNAMADELEHTLLALKNERDTVAKLLQTRRELVASVSHELRTPVATVRGYLESSLSNWGDAPPLTLRQDLGIVEREIKRLQSLIDDLFTLSRAEVGRLTMQTTVVDVGSAITQVVETAKTLAWGQGKVRVVVSALTDGLQVQADLGRLEQILYNLIHNAIRHTPPGGIVAVSAAIEGQQVRIDVQDTGSGIAAEDLPRIWELFFRGDREDGQHAGLGLALVKELTEAMGGSVSAESITGQGSCFRVYLPTANYSAPNSNS